MSNPRLPELTNRQREVLRLYGQRYRVKEIARALEISENTASGYLTEAAALLGAGGRAAAAATLLAYEAAHPEARGRFSAGASPPPTEPTSSPPAAAPEPITTKPASRWSGLIGKRGDGNDLSATERLLAAVGIAFIVALGLGLFAIFVRTVSDVVRLASG